MTDFMFILQEALLIAKPNFVISCRQRQHMIFMNVAARKRLIQQRRLQTAQTSKHDPPHQSKQSGNTAGIVHMGKMQV